MREKSVNENKLSEFELNDLIRNKHRKLMLITIYQSPKRYSDLIELTKLKPGSLYHHLSVLKPLVEKRAHGIYHITKQGTIFVEKFNLVTTEEQKPNIKNSKTTKISNSTKLSINSLNQTDLLDNSLSIIWLGPVNYILLAYTIIITLILSYYGVSLAGSSIYAIGGWISLAFDIAAFILGWISLYFIDHISSKNRIYGELRYSLTIRLLSMLPAAIIGLGLFLLFLNDTSPESNVYPWLFAITIFFGLIASASGIYYLRGKSATIAFQIASVPIIIDLLLGIVVLIS